MGASYWEKQRKYYPWNGTIMGWDGTNPVPWDGMGLGQKRLGWDGTGTQIEKKMGWDGTRPIPFTSLF